jgi:conserved oligomeric Golgi complex subunit 3
MIKDGRNATIGHTDPLEGLFEETTRIKSPPKATVARRAKSYSDFYRVARAQLLKDSKITKTNEKEAESREVYKRKGLQFESLYDAHEAELIDASQEEFRYAHQFQWLR